MSAPDAGAGPVAAAEAVVYEFLVVEGYHGHYPSAQEQAEKLAAQLAAAGLLEDTGL